jgi:peroxiredoxin
LSDFNREAIQAYEVVCEDLVGLKNVAHRSAFVINCEGVIVYSWVAPEPKVLPNFDAVKKALEV